MNGKSDQSVEAAENGSGYGFGAFKGVFLPSVLTVLGVIMYLRLGWVLGNVGLGLTIVIVTLASAITFLTALSIAALATNMRVGGGGAYFIISRSLGIEAGGAIGLPLYLAQAVGIAFYIAGFSESVVHFFPFLSAKLVGVATLTAVTGIAALSADLALKSQLLILGTIVLSLVSFFLGASPTHIVASPAAEAALATPAAFWVVFAVFFPAVTGIEAGLAMSGDLKNPSRSLPVGTLAAVLVGYLVYLAIPVFLSEIVAEKALFMETNLIMMEVARWGPLIVLGLWGATLSSALGALLGAPRTMQALARDRVLPAILGRGHGKGDDPRIATAVSFAIAFVAILLGDLNLIAPVLSMFFLTSYGILNLSSAFAGLIASPSWRPSFRTPWPISLLGAAGCLFAMFMIDPGATFAAMIVTAAVYYIIKRRSLTAHWGDMRYGIIMLLVQFGIARLARRPPDERTWRPNILVLSGSPTSRFYLVELAAALSHGKGLLTVASVVPTSMLEAERILSLRKTVSAYLDGRGIQAITCVHPAANVLTGARELVRAYGFGPVAPNTFVLGETEKEENFVEFAGLVKEVFFTRRNLVVVREGRPRTNFGRERRIDVWWGGLRQNEGLLLALAWLLRTNPNWADSTLRIRTIVEDAEARESARRRIEGFLERGRLDAEADVLLKNAAIPEMIRECSADASIVFMGLKPPTREESDEEYSRYYADILARTEDLPPTALVLAAEKIEFHRIFE